MKCKYLTQLSLVIICILFTTCKTEKQKFSELLLTNDLTLAYKFQSQYPKSAFSIDSLIQSLEYHKLLASPSIEGYREFLKKFPSSNLTDSIKLQLSELEWNKISEISMKSDYLLKREDVEKFYNEFRESPHRSKVEELMFMFADEGKFTDTRDGKEYSWIRFGDKIWMTQNLNFNIRNSFLRGDDKYESPQAGRAYGKDVIWDACPDGWDIPTLDEWITLVFSLGAEARLFRNNNNWNSIIIVPNGMNYTRFNPFLDFHNYRDETRFWVTMALSGTKYWAKTFFEMSDNIIETIHWDYDDRARKINSLDISPIFRRDACPIRCIKRLNSIKYFTTSKSDSILISGVRFSKSELPTGGIYRLLITEKDGECTNPLIIKYLENQIYCFIGKGTSSIYSSHELYALNISYSKDSGKFLLSLFSKEQEIGWMKIENDKIILELTTPTENIKGEYSIITNIGIGWFNQQE